MSSLASAPATNSAEPSAAPPDPSPAAHITPSRTPARGRPGSSWRTALATQFELGRVSNLPTVWSNSIAAIVLCGASATILASVAAVAALSALYIGGMYLNDACDADIDARERPERPIPSGRISQRRVFALASLWFVAGTALFALASGPGLAWTLPAGLLIGCIVAYDRHHKGNPAGPLLMGGCRALGYATVAVALAGALAWPVVLLALACFAWTVGLTAIAKRAARFPSVSIGLLIAMIAMIDALAIAASGRPGLAVTVAACLPATLLLQRRVSGT